MKSIKASPIVVIIVVVILFGQGKAAADGGWFAGLFGGRLTDATEEDVFTLEADYVDSHMGGIVVGKRLWTYKDWLDIEAEGQILRHWGLQEHFEFNALVVFRWLPFPWDKYLDTSFAIGGGLSYATEEPELEKERIHETSKLMTYLMGELAFAVPTQPRWKVFMRFHHRSGVFGLINDISGGSNAVGVGVKYCF